VLVEEMVEMAIFGAPIRILGLLMFTDEAKSGEAVCWSSKCSLEMGA
jgi:hypothetical protein